MNQKKFNLSISWKLIISLILGLLPIIIDFLSDLLENGWNVSNISLDRYILVISVTIFVFTFVVQFTTDKVTEILSKIQVILSNLRNNIQDDTKSTFEMLKKDIDNFKRDISQGIVRIDNYTYRALHYYEDRGTIENGFSNNNQQSRNILVSNATINLIFRNIKLLREGALKEIGRKSSERFANDLVDYIQSETTEGNIYSYNEDDLHSWILSWIKYDSDAGFGKFVIEKDRDQWKNNMNIVLRHPFLATDYTSYKEPICDFMTGYIEGILNRFPDPVLSIYGLSQNKIRISHDTTNPNECVCAGRNPAKGCVYHINILA